MAQPNLVLIHGLKESGKSTTADRLVERYGYVRVKMADVLKNMVRSLLRDAGYDDAFVERCVEGDLKAEPLDVFGGKTTRYVMQTLGTEWRDMILETLWVGIAAEKIGALLAEGRRVVVDDLRFPHEIRILSRFAPEMWVITRGNAHFQSGDAHVSEKPMPVDLFDWHISNDWGSKDSLWKEVDARVAA